LPRRDPYVSVVIVNYRQWDWTAKLIGQLLRTASGRSGAAEVVIVDNHSPAHPLVKRLRRRPGVSLRRWGRNRGFARAVNEAGRLSRGDWLLLLNPDMAVPEGFLDGVVDLAERLAVEDPRAGIVGFQLCNGDGSRQLSSGYFPTLIRTVAGLALPRARRKYRALQPRQRCRVAWVTGCCLLVRRDCFRQLGGFAKDFFLYYEDVDLCRRAHAAGWTVWYEPALHAIHHRPLHSRPVSRHLRFFTRHALLTYGARHWSGWQFRLLAGMVRLEAWLRQCWARWQGHAAAARLYGELRALAGDMAEDRRAAVRRRLRHCVREWELVQA
jgi:GT2 family glycosyltransferase